MVHKADEFKDDVPMTTANIDGKWVISRPVNYKYRTLPQRIQEAYGVFIGKYDAVEFYKQ